MPASPAISAVDPRPFATLGHRADEDPELCVSLEQDLGHTRMVTTAG